MLSIIIIIIIIKCVYQNVYVETLPSLGNQYNYVPLEKIMAIDVLNANWSLVEAEKSNSYSAEVTIMSVLSCT